MGLALMVCRCSFVREHVAIYPLEPRSSAMKPENNIDYAYCAFVKSDQVHRRRVVPFAMPYRSDVDSSIQIPQCSTSVFRPTYYHRPCPRRSHTQHLLGMHTHDM